MHKETSSRVSTLAAEIMRTHAPITAGTPGPGIEFIEKRIYDELLEKAKTLAASCMSQDEHAGQAAPKGDFLSRLKDEREDLDERLTKLAAFMTKGAPGTKPLHKEILGRQLIAMSEYLAILDERLTDINIAVRSAPVNPDKEPEFNGANQ